MLGAQVSGLHIADAGRTPPSRAAMPTAAIASVARRGLDDMGDLLDPRVEGRLAVTAEAPAVTGTLVRPGPRVVGREDDPASSSEPILVIRRRSAAPRGRTRAGSRARRAGARRTTPP